jgi:FMN-dependent oxidoreductase (nitrilotriacetate monooxygenase family)
MREMVMIGFLQAQNCSNFAGSWRHPDARSDFTSPDYYAHIARVLEAGKFQLAFFDDRLGMPEFHGGRFAEAVAHGIRCVKMDPIACLMPMAMGTTRLGLGSTYSTTYYHPFHVARLFQTLDLMTRGRAAWNVVTSMNDVEAQNMGLEEAVEHDARYDRADEFMEVVHGHWDTWADDALIVDKATGRFADPEKVRRIDHRGRHFRSRGPFTVPRSPQGHPVVIQAGQSGRGRRFAARWGELLFTSNPNLGPAKKAYAELKADAAGHGRNPDQMKIATLCHPVVAATRAEAEDKFALIERLPLEVDSLMLLSENTNFDFGSKPLDEPFTDAELARFTGTQSGRDRVLAALAGSRMPTPRDFHHHHPARQAAAAVGRGPQGGRRHLRGVVLRARLRRFRGRRRLRARQLRGFHHLRHPRAAAPRPVPQGLRGCDAAGEPRPASARRRPGHIELTKIASSPQRNQSRKLRLCPGT